MQVELLMQIEDIFMIVLGEILAQSSTVYTVTVNPVKISSENKEKVASKLSEIFELDYTETLEKVNQNVAIVNIAKKVDKEKTDLLRIWMDETGILDAPVEILLCPEFLRLPSPFLTPLLCSQRGSLQ